MVKKNIPQFEDFQKQEPTNVIKQVRTYQLITPLFGGGVNPGEVDWDMPIRGSEIRGNLRFWWRACRGGKYGDNLKDLKDEEDKIWGKAYKKGEEAPEYDAQVSLFVENSKIKPKLVAPFKVEQDGRKNGRLRYKSKVDKELGIPSYAAFPLQHPQEDLDQEPRPEPKTVGAAITFKLEISFPENRREDVEAALWAWETFGGIGARTRRGFGALRCTGMEENTKPQELDLPVADQKQARDWLQKKLIKYVVETDTWHKEIPHLSRQLIARGKVRLISIHHNDALKIWKHLIERLRSFRQSRPGKVSGRSLWPEPNAIRKLLGQSLSSYRSSLLEPLISKFPRAEFGLPIIFKFKDDNQRYPDKRDADPRKTVLQPEGAERFASPLLLKPLACKGENAIGLALILEGVRPGETPLELKAQIGSSWKENVKAYLDEPEEFALKGLDNQSPISITHQTDILQTFLRSL